MKDKFAKRDTCEYCGKQMEAKYRNKRFCSDRCRTYFNREKPKVKITDLNKDLEQGQPMTPKPPKTDKTINTIQPSEKEMPAGLNRIQQMRWMRENS